MTPGCGVTAIALGLGPRDSEFESRHPDRNSSKLIAYNSKRVKGIQDQFAEMRTGKGDGKREFPKAEVLKPRGFKEDPPIGGDDVRSSAPRQNHES